MKIEDLKNVRLSEMTAGYLAILLKLYDLYGEVSSVTELDYSGDSVDHVYNDFNEALNKAVDEIMKLVAISITYNTLELNNHTEI